jgi:hypothetical protein
LIVLSTSTLENKYEKNNEIKLKNSIYSNFQINAEPRLTAVISWNKNNNSNKINKNKNVDDVILSEAVLVDNNNDDNDKYDENKGCF